MYSDSKKNIAKIEIPSNSPIALAPVTVRSRKNPSGIKGPTPRASIATNTASNVTAPAMRPMVVVEPQWCASVLTIA